MARGSWSSCWLSGFTLSPGGRGRRKDFEEEFLIELRDFSADGLSEKLIGEVAEDAIVSKGVLGESEHELVGHQTRVACLGERMLQVLEELGRGLGIEVESESDAAGNRQELRVAEQLGEPLVATEHDGEKAAGVEVGAGQDAELGKHGGVHFLSFIDEQDWPMEAGAEILEPLVAQSFEAAPAIVRRERNSEEIAEFAIEVTEVALGSDDDADGNVGDLREFSSGDSESDGFTRSGFAGDKGEPSVTNLVLQTPAKVLDLGVDPEGVVRQFGGKRIPLETVQGLKLVVHDCSLGFGSGNGRKAGGRPLSA